MSQFTIAVLPCPVCRTEITFDLVQSVNADRMPSLREQILNRTFQTKICPSCSTEFRVEPEFNYVEHGSQLWVAVFPLHRLEHWHAEELEAEQRFKRIYGETASPFIHDIGKTLRRRLAFGWAAIREKLLIADLGLDDITIELLKSATLRASESAPVGLGMEFRLVGGDADHLALAWMRSRDESPVQMIRVKRSLYDEIGADAEHEWAPLRAQFDGMFVDLGRLLITPAEEPN